MIQSTPCPAVLLRLSSKATMELHRTIHNSLSPQNPTVSTSRNKWQEMENVWRKNRMWSSHRASDSSWFIQYPPIGSKTICSFDYTTVDFWFVPATCSMHNYRQALHVAKTVNRYIVYMYTHTYSIYNINDEEQKICYGI